MTVKASDISDEAFIAALEPDGAWTMIWDLCDRLGYPEKVVRAKAKTMITRRKTVDGCYCGCRGDFHLVQSVVPRVAP
jgi:hypothetical protein